MAVYDVFPFFNEIDLLEIRLNHLNPIVDYFVITECTTTFSGQKKKLYFDENKDKFSKFSKKIIHQVIENVPKLDPFSRDRYQRDQAKLILEKQCESKDFIIYGDVDEIPKSSAINSGFTALEKGARMAHLAQDLFYFYLNVQEISNTLMSYTGEYPMRVKKKWLGTNISHWEYARHSSMTDLRNPIHKKNGVRIKDGGWHFTYIGSSNQESASERIRRKIISAAHQELNTEKILEQIGSNIENLNDLFGRKRTHFKIMENLEYLPEYVQININKFEYLLRK